MVELAPARVREQTAKRLSTPVDKLPTSYLSRSRRKAGTAFLGGKLMLSRALRKGGGDLEADLQAAESIASSLGELKGVAMKMGQILGYFEAALPAQVRTALSVLHTHAHPMPFEQVRRMVNGELGKRANEIVDRLEPEPIAVASIGQVHRAVLPDGRAVAVKVQYPGIDKAIRTDLGPAAVGAAVASFFFPGARLGKFVRQARTRFLEECDYHHEARSQRRFHDLFAHHPTILVPKVHGEYCTGRILTTTLCEGVHLEDYLALGPSQQDRDRFGAALFEFYLGSLFKFGLYNCDPHPGNYLFRSDGRIALLDHGCTRQFAPAFVDQLAALTQAVHADDSELLHRAMVDLGIVQPGQRYDRRTARGVIRSLYGPMLRDETFAFELGAGRDAGQIAKRKLVKLALPGEFLFLTRVRFGLASVLARLGARANWHQLERAAIAARPIRASGTREVAALFDVILTDPGDSQVQVIRAIRAATGFDLKTVKGLVDGAPQPVRRALQREEAEALGETLQAAGGNVEIKPTARG